MTIKTLSFLSGLLLCATATAEIYKWTDGSGNTFYSDKPPATAAEVLDIPSQRTDPERIAKLTSTEKDAEPAPVTVASEEQREELEKKREQQRDENCTRARQALASLQSATRVYEPLPGGDRRYLEQDEVDQRMTTAQNDVDKWCNTNG